MPSAVILFRIWHPILASTRCAGSFRAIIAGPIVLLYREKAVSALHRELYLELAPHRRFPSRSRPRMLRLRSLHVGDLGLMRAFFLGGIKTRGERPSR